MMDNLRAAANHVVLKIILALIILSFVLTGVGNYLVGGSNNYAAKVNGQVIERAQLEEVVWSERNRMQQQLGDQFSQLAGDERYMQQLRSQTLAQLIDNVLLNQYADKLGLNVTNEQVKEAIRGLAEFQTNGQFDNTKYLDLVRRMNSTPDQFAQYMRQQLINQQLVQTYGSSGFVLPSELQQLIALTQQERDVRLATLDVNALVSKQNVTDGELQNYYNNNKNSFIEPEKVKVSYIAMDVAAQQAKITVSDADIAAYYEQHKASFTQPERRNYSIIQLKNEADAVEVLAALKKGKDFSTLAKEKSTDVVSKRNGGQLGWMELATTPDEIKHANLSEKGQLSDVLKLSGEYAIIKLNDIQPEVVKPLAKVHDDIAKQLHDDKALDAFYALQQKVSEAAANDNESLASAAEASGLKVQETDWFSRDKLPAVLDSKAVEQAIFNGNLQGKDGEPGNNSDVITIDKEHAVILRIAGHQPEHVKPLEKVKDSVIAMIKHDKAEQAARAQAEELLTLLKQGKEQEVMKKAGLSFGEVQKITRNSEDNSLVESVFSLAHPQQGKPVYGIAQDNKDNILLIALDAVRAGELSENISKQFAAKAQSEMTAITFNSLLNNLRQEAKIKMGDALESR